MMPFHFNMLVFCLALLLSALIGWPIAALARRRKGERSAPDPRRARWLAGVVARLYLLPFVTAPLMMMFAMTGDPDGGMFSAMGSVEHILRVLTLLILLAVNRVGLDFSGRRSP
jgi:hypothetical protein